MENKIVLLTGATGRSGSYFLKRLAEENPESYSFKAIVRGASHTELLDNISAEKIIGNLTDEDFLNHALAGVDEVLHIAGIKYSPALVRAAIKNDVKRLILVHTTGIYSKFKAAGEEYLQIEQHIEDALKDTNIALTILRPTMIFGSLDDHNISVFIKLVDKFPLTPVVSGAKFALQPVHQGDLGNAYYDVLINSDVTANKNYILSGSYPIELIDILKSIGEYLGKKTHTISIPFWLAYLGACILYFISLGRLDIREKVQRLIEPRAYSHEEAKKDFGYSPVDFQEGLKKEVGDYQHYLRQR